MELTYAQYWQQAEALGISLDEAATAIEMPPDVFDQHARAPKGKSIRMTSRQDREGRAFLARGGRVEVREAPAPRLAAPVDGPGAEQEARTEATAGSLVEAVRLVVDVEGPPVRDDRIVESASTATEPSPTTLGAPQLHADAIEGPGPARVPESKAQTRSPNPSAFTASRAGGTRTSRGSPPPVSAEAGGSKTKLPSPTLEDGTREEGPQASVPERAELAVRGASPIADDSPAGHSDDAPDLWRGPTTAACQNEMTVDPISQERAHAAPDDRVAATTFNTPSVQQTAEPTKVRSVIDEKQVQPAFRPLDLVNASSIEASPLSYLWPGRVPKRSVTLIAGYPDRGKSLLAALMAAKVSAGAAWPDASECTPPGTVLMLGTEDDHETVVVPRLLAAGADLSRVKVLPPESGSFGAEEFVGRLDAALQASNDIRLVILDPLMALLRGLSTGGNDRVRAVMESLQIVAARHDLAIVGIIHPNKRQARQIVDALPGARALSAVVRTTWWVDNDPTDPERKIMIPVMGRYGSAGGLGFRVEVVTVKGGLEAPRLLADGGPVRVTWNDLVSDLGKTSALDEARRFIRTELGDGPLPSEELVARANAAGISKATLRRAEQSLVERRKSGMGGPWMVQLVGAPKMLNAAEGAHVGGDEHLRGHEHLRQETP